MSIDDFILALQGTRTERADLDAIELIVTLRKPDEVEELVRQNAALRAENLALMAKLKEHKSSASELIGLYSRLKKAKKILKDNGLSTQFLER